MPNAKDGIARPRRWVLWSTRRSIQDGIISWVAFAETIIALFLAAWVVKNLGEYKSLFPSSLTHFIEFLLSFIPPGFFGLLTLLRCRKSERLGVRWFRQYEKKYLKDWSEFSENRANRWGQREYWGGVMLATVTSASSVFLFIKINVLLWDQWLQFWQCYT
jgi:hypothetical protein